MGLNDKLVICPECIKKFSNDDNDLVYGYKGYYTILLPPQNMICSKCGTKLAQTNITKSDFSIIQKISKNRDFIQAMIDLHDKDIVEYELKMSQFRIQAEQQKSIKNEQINNDIQCPYCKSNNINKISSTSRVASTYLLGLGSKKIGKQWHCNKCGSDF